jgi:hypothetical protein
MFSGRRSRDLGELSSGKGTGHTAHPSALGTKRPVPVQGKSFSAPICDGQHAEIVKIWRTRGGPRIHPCDLAWLPVPCDLGQLPPRQVVVALK